MANVTFSATKADGSEILLSLRNIVTGATQRLSFQDGDEVRPIDEGVTYIAVLDVVGSIGDKTSITWSAGDDGDDLVSNFKIDPHHVDARPWPGGKWYDRLVTGLRI